MIGIKKRGRGLKATVFIESVGDGDATRTAGTVCGVPNLQKKRAFGVHSDPLFIDIA
jgi:hypothetical protein